MKRETETQPKREITIAERKILLEKQKREREQMGRNDTSGSTKKEDERLKNTDTKVIIAIAVVVLTFVIFFVVRLVISNIPPKELDYHTFNFSSERIEDDVNRRVQEFYQGFGALDINIVDDYTTRSARRGFEQRIALLYVASKMTSQNVEIKNFKPEGFRIEDDHVSMVVSYTIKESDQFGNPIRSTDAVETLKLKYYERRDSNKWIIYENHGSTPDGQDSGIGDLRN